MARREPHGGFTTLTVEIGLPFGLRGPIIGGEQDMPPSTGVLRCVSWVYVINGDAVVIGPFLRLAASRPLLAAKVTTWRALRNEPASIMSRQESISRHTKCPCANIPSDDAGV